MLKTSNVSNVKNNRAIKIIPIDSNKNTVVFDDIDIFLKESVGTLLTNNKDINTVK
tara:strand:+ start:384 stop:551 length:168 start_codon:yes stop_codon:yes gene_type:complete